jgi:hypothetical protein
MLQADIKLFFESLCGEVSVHIVPLLIDHVW